MRRANGSAFPRSTKERATRVAAKRAWIYLEEVAVDGESAKEHDDEVF